MIKVNLVISLNRSYAALHFDYILFIVNQLDGFFLFRLVDLIYYNLWDYHGRLNRFLFFFWLSFVINLVTLLRLLVLHDLHIVEDEPFALWIYSNFDNKGSSTHLRCIRVIAARAILKLFVVLLIVCLTRAVTQVTFRRRDHAMRTATESHIVLTILAIDARFGGVLQ